MLKTKKYFIIPVTCLALCAILFDSYFSINKFNRFSKIQELDIIYPYEGMIFPQDSSPPTFQWDDSTSEIHRWEVFVDFNDNAEPVKGSSESMEWIPDSDTWETIKRRSCERNASVIIRGLSKPVGKNHLGTTKSAGTISFSTAAASVITP